MRYLGGNDVDLTKPWVTEALKAEFAKKTELLIKAKASQDQSDWAAFREQCNLCRTKYSTARTEHVGKHGEEVRIPQLMPASTQKVPVVTAFVDYTADVIL